MTRYCVPFARGDFAVGARGQCERHKMMDEALEYPFEIFGRGHRWPGRGGRSVAKIDRQSFHEVREAMLDVMTRSRHAFIASDVS